MFTDLREIKVLLEIDSQDTEEDILLGFLIEQSSQWIEEILNRPGMAKKSRTEFYNGTGNQKLLLRSRPVFTTPTIQVFQDEGGNFGATSGSFNATDSALVYGTDFALVVDQENGTSRSGILYRINELWPRPSVRQRGLLSPFLGTGFGTIKVVYTAGYEVDNLPASLRLAANLLVQRLRYIMPLGMELTGDSFEERNMSIVTSAKEQLLVLVKPLLLPYRNWKWW